MHDNLSLEDSCCGSVVWRGRRGTEAKDLRCLLLGCGSGQRGGPWSCDLGHWTAVRCKPVDACSPLTSWVCQRESEGCSFLWLVSYVSWGLCWGTGFFLLHWAGLLLRAACGLPARPLLLGSDRPVHLSLSSCSTQAHARLPLPKATQAHSCGGTGLMPMQTGIILDKGWDPGLYVGRRILYHGATQGSPGLIIIGYSGSKFPRQTSESFFESFFLSWYWIHQENLRLFQNRWALQRFLATFLPIEPYCPLCQGHVNSLLLAGLALFLILLPHPGIQIFTIWS